MGLRARIEHGPSNGARSFPQWDDVACETIGHTPSAHGAWCAMCGESLPTASPFVMRARRGELRASDRTGTVRS
jgi:hypothetical protein